MSETAPSKFWRQLDIYDPDKDLQPAVTIVGVGGLGSFTAFSLKKLGIKNLLVIDKDFVEEHNIPNQLYDDADLGLFKAHAIHLKTKASYVLADVTSISSISGNIILSLVDSMEVRKRVWEKALLNSELEFFLDARMGGSVLKIFCVDPLNPHHVKAYYESLHDDSSSLDVPCTAAGIVDVGLVAASLITRLIRKYVKGKQLPFLLVYDHENLKFHVFSHDNSLIVLQEESQDGETAIQLDSN